MKPQTKHPKVARAIDALNFDANRGRNQRWLQAPFAIFATHHMEFPWSLNLRFGDKRCFCLSSVRF